MLYFITLHKISQNTGFLGFSKILPLYGKMQVRKNPCSGISYALSCFFGTNWMLVGLVGRYNKSTFETILSRNPTFHVCKTRQRNRYNDLFITVAAEKPQRLEMKTKTIQN